FVTAWEMKVFFLKTNNVCGPTRLGRTWTDTSLVSCGLKCRRMFSSDCSSFMFHKVTKLCTPGGRLSSLQPIPAVHEGELYILMSDDLNDKFSFISYNSTTVQLFYFKTEVNYRQALEICRCFNSTLNVAKTNDKYQLFASLVKETKHDTWIGLDDIESEGHFVWVDDKQEYNTSISPSYFQGDQPDNYNNNEDCVMMRGSNLQLNDERCDKTFYFICEKP
ncbi:collectin-10, partial [Biomphalaria pfeifferi]